jgi:hypothetical protein
MSKTTLEPLALGHTTDEAGAAKMNLEYLGRQGMCCYYWRVFRDGSKVLYARVDGGTLQPVAT